MSVEKLIYDPTAGPGIVGVCGNCLNGGHHICDSENCKCKANGHKAWWWVPKSNKIELWTPWEWEEMTSHLPGKEAQGTTIMSSGGHYVCHQLNIRQAKQRQELAHAICSAINGTYGSGINPEAVPELLSALHGLLNINGAISSGNEPYIKERYEAAREAIEKAKLK